MAVLGWRDPTNVCGTLRGYDRHRYHGEKPCVDCNTVKERDNTLRAVRTGRQKTLLVPYVLLGELLQHAPADLVAYAEETLRVGAVEAAQLAVELVT